MQICKKNQIATVLSLTALLAAGGWAYVAHASCTHMMASTRSHDLCATCTSEGPVAANNGSSCTYYDGDRMAFCDCAPNVDCKLATFSVDTHVTLYTGGVCSGGGCTAVRDSSWQQLLPMRYSSGCVTGS